MKRTLATALIACATVLPLTGCSTAPKDGDRASVISRGDSTARWFKGQVNGLTAQIKGSAGYIVFPDVSQWGILIGGGQFGRGIVCRPNGTQIGWAAINTGSIGLQAGVQGFRMLMVLENERVLNEFKEGKWNGSASGVAVLGEAGGSGATPFQNGLAIYEGANSGLMVGVNIGLNNIRYQALEAN